MGLSFSAFFSIDGVYGGKLSSRTISTGVEEFSWEVSSCQSVWCNTMKRFKTPEFRFAELTCSLFVDFEDNDCIKFGIRVRLYSTPVEEFDCCCNLSYRNLDGEVFKSSELKFKCAEGMPEIGMKDIFQMKISEDIPPRKVQDNAIIVCRLSTNISIDTSCSREAKAEKYILVPFIENVALFEKGEVCSRGELTRIIISAEEEELIWDISSSLMKKYEENSSVDSGDGISRDFSFGGGTWYLLAEVEREKKLAFFGIAALKSCSTEEVFDCCCKILLQNFEGKIFQRFQLKFKCDKAIPLISMVDVYQSWKSTQGEFNTEEGLVIVCRISSKKIITTESCPNTEITYSGESNAVEVHKPAHLPEQKNDDSSIVNSIYNVFHVLKQLLQSGDVYDMIYVLFVMYVLFTISKISII